MSGVRVPPPLPPIRPTNRNSSASGTRAEAEPSRRRRDIAGPVHLLRHERKGPVSHPSTPACRHASTAARSAVLMDPGPRPSRGLQPSTVLPSPCARARSDTVVVAPVTAAAVTVRHGPLTTGQARPSRSALPVGPRAQARNAISPFPPSQSLDLVPPGCSGATGLTGFLILRSTIRFESKMR